MSTLTDCEMDRLSDLFARGNIENADEIATLLKAELGEKGDLAPESESLESYFDLLGLITSRR